MVDLEVSYQDGRVVDVFDCEVEEMPWAIVVHRTPHIKNVIILANNVSEYQIIERNPE